MISLLPLQEFMPLTSVQGKLHAFALCSIFYVDSLHAVWYTLSSSTQVVPLDLH
ncbi:hypothetical protein BHE74_00027039 [Ensete ventricosum]|nr:hypothetical protein BHE74_00027039 [Ensete ventricosum]